MKKRRAKGSHKGNGYERQICRELSLWWSSGDREDIFWRTSGSGARATMRSKQNKKTANQCGDICAIDVIGKPLLDLVSIEIKRGYSRNTIADLFDRSGNAKEQQWEGWIKKAIAVKEQSGSFSWMIISRRDRREPVVVMPVSLISLLTAVSPSVEIPNPRLRFVTTVGGSKVSLYGMHLTNFLETFQPSRIKRVLKEIGR